MAVGLLNPLDSDRSVRKRPTHLPTGVAQMRWYSEEGDGTNIRAQDLNAILAQIRNAVSHFGLPLTEGNDNALRQAMEAAVASVSTDPGFIENTNAALTSRLRVDAEQGLDDTQQQHGRSNLGLGALAILATIGTAEINNGAVTNAKQAPLVQGRIRGRASGAGSGPPQDLTAAQVKTLLMLAAGDISGLGSAATQDIGTSGETIPLLNGVNTWSDAQTFAGGIKATAISAVGVDATLFIVGNVDFSGGLLSFDDAAAVRDALGLGSAATMTAGTSGSTVPLLNASNVFSGGRTSVTGLMNLGSPQPVVIAGGAITPSASYIRVDTEASAAADELDTINGGLAGDILVLQPVDFSRDTTIRHMTGNISLAGGVSHVLTTRSSKLLLIFNGATSTWDELARV